MAETIEREAQEKTVTQPSPGNKNPSEAAAKKKQKARRKKIRRRIITLIVVIAILGGIAFGMYRLFQEEEIVSEALTAFVYRGSIQSMVTGYGQTMPKNSATITLSAGGTVLDVFVGDGDLVNEGDPLYVIDSTAAQQAVEDARKTVENYQKQLDALNKSYAALVVRAEHSGTLLETADIRTGDSVGSGTQLAMLVDDSKMKLELYFSYAYQDMIAVGQAAAVSVPSAMNELGGVVTEVNYVRRVTPEGSQLFAVTIEVSNPGTLADKMGASAVITGSDGEEMYPYEAGEFTYVRKTPIRTETGGTALSVNLRNYSQVTRGQVLLEMSGDNNDEAAAALENQMSTARENLEKAQKNLENFNASAPMSGTVLSCSLRVGETVETGRAAITIANTTEMVIEAQVDDMNIAYVKPGMYCDVTQYSRDEVLNFSGIVETVSLEAKSDGGRSYFPAVIKVDNYDGRLMSGMYVDYSLVASQSDDCLIVPIQAVTYTMEGVCLFVRAESPPENVLNTEEMGIEVPEGFYAVPVTIGISDNSSVEIIEGVEEGAEVFTQYAPTDYNSGGGGGMIRIG